MAAAATPPPPGFEAPAILDPTGFEVVRAADEAAPTVGGACCMQRSLLACFACITSMWL